MGCVFTVLLVVAGGQDLVRLQLRDGGVAEGAMSGVDAEGHYILRTSVGGRERIPYGDVLHIERLSDRGAAPSAEDALPSWPSHRRMDRLLGDVLDALPHLPAGAPPDAAGGLGRAVDMARAGEMREAVRELGIVLDAAPSWVAARMLRAAILGDMGEAAQAQEDADMAVALAGELALAHDMAAEIAYRRGLAARGDALAAAALERRYTGAERDWRLGHFWLARDAAKARQYFESYLDKDPHLRLPFCVEGQWLARLRGERDAGRLDHAGRYAGLLRERSPWVAEHVRRELGELLRMRAEVRAREGRVHAAAADMEEAAAWLPEESEALEADGLHLVSNALQGALMRASSRAQIGLLEGQFARVRSVVPPDAIRAVTRAYLRVGGDMLGRGAVAAAADCIAAAAAHGVDAGDLERTLELFLRRGTPLSADAARILSAAVGRAAPGYLRAQGGWLLAPQIEALRARLDRGEEARARAELVELERLFGDADALLRLRGDLARRETPARDLGGRVPPAGGVEGAVYHELLRYCPLDVGRWWAYVSERGHRETWRVTSAAHSDGVLRAELEGTVQGPGGSTPASRTMYFTGREIIAQAPSLEAGGRLVLWGPLGAGGAARIQRSAGHVRERSLLSLDAKVRGRDTSFDACLHVRVRSSLDAPQAQGTEFSVESHYWYAPDIGLVRIEAEGGEVWELLEWGWER